MTARGTEASRAGDPQAVLALLHALLGSIRGAGVPVSTAQAIDAARALTWIDLASQEDVRTALAAIVTCSREERARFDEAFTAFFARARGTLANVADVANVGGAHARARASAGGLVARLLEAGLVEDEIATILARLRALEGGERLEALLGDEALVGHLLRTRSMTRLLEGLHADLQLGAFAHRALERLGIVAAHATVERLQAGLAEVLGERASLVAHVLRRELRATGDRVRADLRRTLAQRTRTARVGTAAMDRDRTPWASLSPREAEEVRAALRAFAARLNGGESVRTRRAARGALDAQRTLRKAMATGGVPFVLARRTRRHERPRLVLLCDVSDSVRAASGFLLELVQAAHASFPRTRSFVFVSELAETTALFAGLPAAQALARATALPRHANSNYGRVLRAFEAGHLREVDRRTTVVVLGDGRTNFHEAAPDVLDRVRARASALYWLSTERRSAWGSGDSAMARYAPRCTAVLEVTNAGELREAARLLARRRAGPTG